LAIREATTQHVTASINVALGRVRYELRTVAADYPSIYLPYARRAHAAGPGKVLGRDTELLIEGFTRSGTTFAVVAFQLAQARPVRVARHLHVPAHVIAAARLGVPTLVCVRPPEPTVLSQMVREPHISVGQSLRSFARFYERILPHRSHFVITTFEQLTSDFGAAIAAVNARFATDFSLFEHTQHNVKPCFELIEHRSRGGRLRKVLGDFQSGLVSIGEVFEAVVEEGSHKWAGLDERWVARPSKHRDLLKARLKGEYESVALERRRARAERVYSQLVHE
jgi:hypothetical protein